MGTKRIGSGYVLGYSTSGTNAGPWTALTNAKMASKIAQRKPEIDATPLSATAREYIPGLAEGQEVTIEMFYVEDDATQLAIKANYDAGTDTWFRLRHPAASEATEIVFRLTLLNHEVGEFSAENVITRTFSGRLSGDPIFRAKTA
jgi:hypothetical protein